VAELEERLRETVARQSLDYEPSADLPERITARVRRRHRRTRLAAAGAVAATVIVVVAVVAIGGADRGRVRTNDSVTTGTTAPPEESSTSSTTTPSPKPERPAGTATTTGNSNTTVSAPTPVPSRPAISLLTPLNRRGIGPITAGMTVRDAQAAAGLTITPGTSSGGCSTGTFADVPSSPVLLIEPVGGDPLDGIVRAVGGSFNPTAEGAQSGQPRAELLAALGQPTRVEAGPALWQPDGELLVFESGGYAYGAVVFRDQVLDLVSGDPAWIARAADCSLL
jgi:hypothetical protein